MSDESRSNIELLFLAYQEERKTAVCETTAPPLKAHSEIRGMAIACFHRQSTNHSQFEPVGLVPSINSALNLF
jgi:hypothetical protein